MMVTLNGDYLYIYSVIILECSWGKTNTNSLTSANQLKPNTKCKQNHSEIPEPGNCWVWAVWTVGQLAWTPSTTTPGT